MSSSRFDGVVCFGGVDWWYHNRGHYDLQMMRELSRHLPVVFVNSIGIRVPRLGEGPMFFTRVRRKLRSLRRGFVQVREGFSVVSPFVIPSRLGMRASRHLLARQVRAAARRAGIARPLVWITCPPAVEVLEHLEPAAVVYERTDRWESFPDADVPRMLAYDRLLKARADVTVFCSSLLFDEEGPSCRRALYVDHGVDYAAFAAAGKRGTIDAPEDVAQLRRPRAGFIGGIDEHTFDPELFDEVAALLPQVSFFLVGTCSLPAGWCTRPNVTLLGQRPYDVVPRYMAAADVLIMPWRQNDWIQACNPVKLKEYLAVGRPVVSTDFAELRHYEGYVRVAHGAKEFAEQVSEAIAHPEAPEQLRERVRAETWSAKAETVLRALGGALPELPAAV
jgi:glycosyltransferase involved in cell wall biosynthesis